MSTSIPDTFKKLMVEEPLIWVCGPSGVGKSFLLRAVREHGSVLTSDLDFLGFRRASESWKDWTINPRAFQLLAENAAAAQQPVVAAGVASNVTELRRAAVKQGFATVFLAPPSAVVLAQRRKARGDEAAKVDTAAKCFSDWEARFAQWSAGPLDGERVYRFVF